MICLLRAAVPFCLLLILTGCAAQRPVLYPNTTLENEGQRAGQQAIDACMQMARAHGADSAAGSRVAGAGAVGATVGAVTGAAVGAVTGNAGRGAAMGAAGGAAGGVTRGAVNARQPDPVFAAFVERCLRERGYEPIGWR